MTIPSLAEAPVPVKAEAEHREWFTDAQLCDRWQCTPPTLWRQRQRDPRMPKPVKGFCAKNMTPGHEVLEYEQLLIAERDADPNRIRNNQSVPNPPRKKTAD
jgi:hypothetical protein